MKKEFFRLYISTAHDGENSIFYRELGTRGMGFYLMIITRLIAANNPKLEVSRFKYICHDFKEDESFLHKLLQLGIDHKLIKTNPKRSAYTFLYAKSEIDRLNELSTTRRNSANARYNKQLPIPEVRTTEVRNLDAKTIDNVLADVMQDQTWFKEMSEAHSGPNGPYNIDTLYRKVREFAKELKKKGTKYKSKAQFKDHFGNWFNQQQKARA